MQADDGKMMKGMSHRIKMKLPIPCADVNIFFTKNFLVPAFYFRYNRGKT